MNFNRRKKRDHKDDVIPSYKKRAQADVFEFFYDRDNEGALTVKEAIDQFRVVASQSSIIELENSVTDLKDNLTTIGEDLGILEEKVATLPVPNYKTVAGTFQETSTIGATAGTIGVNETGIGAVVTHPSIGIYLIKFNSAVLPTDESKVLIFPSSGSANTYKYRSFVVGTTDVYIQLIDSTTGAVVSFDAPASAPSFFKILIID